MERRLAELAWPADLAASDGDRAAEVCWTALALHIAGKVFIRDAWMSDAIVKAQAKGLGDWNTWRQLRVQLTAVAAKHRRMDLFAYGLLIGIVAGFLTDAVVIAAGV